MYNPTIRGWIAYYSHFYRTTVAPNAQADRRLCHSVGPPQVQADGAPDQGSARLVRPVAPASMPWQRPNILKAFGRRPPPAWIGSHRAVIRNPAQLHNRVRLSESPTRPQDRRLRRSGGRRDRREGPNGLTHRSKHQAGPTLPSVSGACLSSALLTNSTESFAPPRDYGGPVLALQEPTHLRSVIPRQSAELIWICWRNRRQLCPQIFPAL